MAQVTLNPDKDVFIVNTAPTTNQAATGFIDVGEWKGGASDIRRTLMSFDLSSIPTGSTITAATLRIYDSGTDLATNTRTMFANRSKRAWTESGATWNKYDGTNNWTTAGGGASSDDVETSSIGSISMPGTEVAGYVEFALTASAVQEWFVGSFTNNGIMLSMGTESDDLHRFNDSEAASNKPELVVTYEPPASGGFYYMSV